MAGPERGQAEFLAVAELLGHDRDRLLAGERFETLLEVGSLAAARVLLCRADESRRDRRGRSFFDAITNRQRLGQGIHDRGEAHLFADRDVLPADLPGIARHLPMRVRAVSAVRCVVAAGTELDLSIRAAALGLSDDEELYCVANFGTLVLEPGARLVVRGNVFSLVCQRLITRGADGAIAILPTPFAFGRRRGPLDGRPGRPGTPGTPGRDVPPPPVASSVLGPLVQHSPAESRGGDGGPGGAGKAGEAGRNGGACKLAELTLRQLEGHPLTVYSEPGRGGDGGDGGAGGDGGPGGRGVPSHRTLDGPVPQGPRGRDGEGGDGGRGGTGGSSGLSSNIYLVVREDQRDRVVRVSRPGVPGTGGAAGPAGVGGVQGRPGRPGRARGAPTMFLNEEP